MDMQSRPEDTFIEEASDLLQELEESLLALEKDSDDLESVDSAFRSLHTIKGGAAMFKFESLADFTHDLETAFDYVKEGKISVTRELIDIALKSLDHIDTLLHHPEEVEDENTQALLLGLNDLIPNKNKQSSHDNTANADDTAISEQAYNASSNGLYSIEIKPSEDTLLHGMDPLPTLRELFNLGECTLKINAEGVPSLSAYVPETMYLSWECSLQTPASLQDIQEVFMFVEGDWEISITEQALPEGNQETQAAEDVDALVTDVLNPASQGSEEKTESKNKTPDKKQKTAKKENKEKVSNVKVPAAKLDSLMDLVGELVIAQARLMQCADRLVDTELMAVSEGIERLTTELRDNSLSLRMLPIGTTFSRFQRLVRDLSSSLGKKINLITEGAETELDKTVIDKLSDPLVHIIRNSIDHGVEMPEERLANGKPETGTVTLSAVHSESNVIIKVKDNGKGIDPEKIRQKAISQGMISEDSALSKSEILNLVFESGFSTAEKLTDISGRGVGMDVVKRSIEELRGKVWIESTVNEGSTIFIELPLTLAIIEGLLVGIEDEKYVLPLSIVEECIELDNKELQTSGETSQLLEVRGELVPYVRLRSWFGFSDRHPRIEQVVVVRYGDYKFGLAVEDVIGQHQTVIKALGKLYEGVSGVSGATILGDGAVALILDVPRFFEIVQESQGGRYERGKEVA